MRLMIAAAALMLAACGASTESSEGAPDPSERALPLGAIMAYGENWSYNADPDPQAISFVVDDGAEPVEVAETWTPPQTTDTGYRLASGEITLALVDEPCTQDGVAYPMRATVTHVTARHEGCAAMRWDHQLIALMPQIDACIARSPETRWVNYAGVQADGNMLVRLSAGDAFDCTVTPGMTPEVMSFGPRSETLTVATEGAAIFVRGPGENPGGECYEAPEVRSADGEVLGWMMDPMGC
mgnify:FL=1